MKKATDQMLKRVLERMEDPDDWNWYATELDSKSWRFQVKATGHVYSWDLGGLPFDWAQRRSVARAYKRLHARLTEQLVAAGKKAMADKQV